MMEMQVSVPTEAPAFVDHMFEFGRTPFYFLRHGETYESREGIVQGQTETELTLNGRKLVETAAEALSNVSLRSIYASPLKRAWRTAAIIAVYTKVPVYGIPGLMERDWGEFEGRPAVNRPSISNPATVEPQEDFNHRVLAAMDAIDGSLPVLVVAHSGVFRAICDLVGIPVDNRVSVSTGQVLRMEPPAGRRETWRISEL
jgi:probable phosphoglycerate mutase